MSSPSPPEDNPPPQKGAVETFAVLGAIASVTGIITNIVRSRVVAQTTGSTGVGIIAESTQLVTLATTAATVLFGPALITWMSQSVKANDWARGERGIGTALTAGLGIATLGCIIAFIVAPWALPDGWEIAPRMAVALCAFGTVLSLAATALNTLFVASVDSWRITLSSLLSSLVAVIASIALTLGFGLVGNFWSITVAAIAAVVIAWTLLRTARARYPVTLRPSLDWVFLRSAFSLGAVTLLSGIVNQSTFSAIRATLQAYGDATGQPHGGEALNGNYQAATTIGTQYFAVVMGGLSNYFWPRFAVAKNTEEIEKEVYDASRFILRLAPPVIVGAIGFRDLLIHLMYSHRFDDAIAILGYQFAGDVTKAVSWAYAGVLLFRARLGAYLVTELLGAGLLIATCTIFLRLLGPPGVGVGYLTSYAIYLVIAAIAVRVSTGARIAWHHLALALGLSALGGGYELALQKAPWLRWASLPIVLVWLHYSGGLRMAWERVGARIWRRLTRKRAAS